MELNDILTVAIKGGASDIHLKAGLPPMFRIDGALMPLNSEYERARAAWRAGLPAPGTPQAHDRLSLAAIDAINRLIDAVSEEAQRYAAALERDALTRLVASFALFAAGLALAYLSWRMVAGAVIEPLEALSGVARRIATGDPPNATNGSTAASARRMAAARG